MWPKVRKAEHSFIFPYMKNADVLFNTALDYEYSVLKVYAKPLFREIPPTSPFYNQAREIMDFLDNFSDISHDHIPSDSLLREFIGNSFFTEVN